MAAPRHDAPESRGGSGKAAPSEQRISIDPSPSNMASDPLDYLMAEHLRQRQFANLLNFIAEGVINRRTIADAIRFVENDLSEHILDEETSFFPILRPLCVEADKIDDLLGLLAEEHREDEGESEGILTILRAAGAGSAPTEAERERLRLFADHLKRHLALENGVLLPLARARMTPEALQILSQSMLRRRGRASN